MSVITDVPSKALIGGQWVDGSDGTFDVRSPHSGEVINASLDATPTTSNERSRPPALRSRAGRPTPLIERVKILRRIHAAGSSSAPSRSRGWSRSRSARPSPTRARRSTSMRRLRGRRPATRSCAIAACRFPSTQEQTNNKRLVMTHRPLGVVGGDHALQLPNRHLVDRAGPHHRGRQHGGLEAVRVLADLLRDGGGSSFDEAGSAAGRGQRRAGLRRRGRRRRRPRRRRRGLLHRLDGDRREDRLRGPVEAAAARARR